MKQLTKQEIKDLLLRRKEEIIPNDGKCCAIGTIIKDAAEQGLINFIDNWFGKMLSYSDDENFQNAAALVGGFWQLVEMEQTFEDKAKAMVRRSDNLINSSDIQSHHMDVLLDEFFRWLDYNYKESQNELQD